MSASETQIIACTTPSDACLMDVPPELRNKIVGPVVINKNTDAGEKKAIRMSSLLIGAPRTLKHFAVNQLLRLKASHTFLGLDYFKIGQSISVHLNAVTTDVMKSFMAKGKDNFVKHIAHGSSFQVNVTEKYTATPNSSPRPQTSGYVVLLPPPECVPRMKHIECLVPVALDLLPAGQPNIAIEAGTSDAGAFARLFVV